jgi:predicted porin
MLEPLREEAVFTLYRGRDLGKQTPILVLAVTAERPSPQSLRRLEHEYSLATELDAAWPAQPVALFRHLGRAVLILKDPGGEPVDRFVEQRKDHPFDLPRFLCIAIGLTSALIQAHRQSLIHKDVKPANALVDDAGHVWLTGFGVAFRLPHERQKPEVPEHRRLAARKGTVMLKLTRSGAAALVVFASGAHAQSSVTLYGVVELDVFYQSANAANFQSKVNLGHVYELKDGGTYSSILGLKGTEDIGGGYTVNFKLQEAFSSNNGTGELASTPTATAMFDEQATVGVSSPYGSLDLGRQIAPMIYAMSDTDVRNAQYFGSVLTGWLGLNQAAFWQGTSTNLPVGAFFDDNAIVYRSPKFYGASLALEYAPGGVPGQFQGGTRESAVLQYSNYGLNLAGVYYNGHDANPFTTTASGAIVTAPSTGLNNNQFYYVGAQYTFLGFSVSSSYSRARNPANSSAPNGFNLEMFSGGLGYTFSPSFKITSGFYYLHDRNVGANHSAEYALGAEYSLSRATLAYAQVGYVDNHGNMSQTIAYGAPVPQGRSSTAAMIGIRHSF